MEAMEKRAVKEVKKYAVQLQMFCRVTQLILDYRDVRCVRVRIKGGQRSYDLWVHPTYATSEQWAKVLPRFDSVRELTDAEILTPCEVQP